jgi:FkbM family methyltransferase
LASAKTQRELVANITSSREFDERVKRPKAESSPFLHFNASVDVRAIIEAHVCSERRPRADHFVNFLGLAIPVRVMDFLHERGGQLDVVPIPANFHADMSEWAAALRAVDLAEGTFSMIELGCGWGCWMGNTGIAARARGKQIHLIGIEGDLAHLDFARETFAVNNIGSSEFNLVRGVAAAKDGYALFPARQGGEEHWGSEPRFGVTREESEVALASGKWESLPMIPLRDVIGQHRRIDLLHMDIQGGEADLVEETLPLLTERVAYIVIGTHSRSIEGRLMTTLLGAGWHMEIERPAIFRIDGGRPLTTVDGVQGWRNPKFVPG